MAVGIVLQDFSINTCASGHEHRKDFREEAQ